ncbi:hypothetical protein [Sandaracinus amylolyticus]|uniref:hypothetical protein n=1 Tax=Sandaracinus amylolyticus TaxID=927083 RepID=UPI001F261C7B|nr:hypothetical protein [Sandaracinus amylolyticus]UJR83609.1 Hypothetical protein I5071_56770 [Sandaracinus amylolyticus]
MTQPQEQQREKERPAKADERKQPERHPHMRDEQAPATTPHQGAPHDVEEMNPDDFE